MKSKPLPALENRVEGSMFSESDEGDAARLSDAFDDEDALVIIANDSVSTHQSDCVSRIGVDIETQS